MALPSANVFVRSIPNMSHLVAGLSAFSGQLRSTREPLERAVEEVIIPRIQRNFEEEGPGWEPLAEGYVDHRGQGSSRHPILQLSGTLYRSAVAKSRWKIQGLSGEAFMTDLGPADSYGRRHETGTSKMPARPFLTIGAEELDAIEEIMEEWIAENATKTIATGALVGWFRR